MVRNLCLFLLVLLAVQCGRTGTEPGIPIAVPLIPDGETNTYRVTALGDSIGTYTTVASHGRFKEIPAYEIVLVTRIRTGDIETNDSSVVYVSRDSMTPLSSFRFVKTGGALITTAANYGPDMVAVSAFSQGEETQRLLPATPNTFDADQLTFLGRSLQVGPDRPVEVNVLSPMGPPLGGRLRTARFIAAGDESVTVPAGVYDCTKYRLEIDESVVELWYDRAATRQLVLYRSEEAGLAMELLPAVPD